MLTREDVSYAWYKGPNLELEMDGTTPALALTRYAAPDEGEHVLTEGFQAHLAKLSGRMS